MSSTSRQVTASPREIEVFFRELFNLLPDLEISGEPERLNSNFIHGIKHMNCKFTPRAA